MCEEWGCVWWCGHAGWEVCGMVRILGGGYMCDEGMKLGRGWVRVHACEVKVPTISVGK